jgi:hypothetical protein
MKKALDSARKEFVKMSSDPFPLITPDLTEMSASEFHNALKQMPPNFSSDFVYDLQELRRILGTFGHHSKVQILRRAAYYTNSVKASPYYKGIW